MIVKLLTEHHLGFLSIKGAAETRPSLHYSKCQIVGNLMPRLNYNLIKSPKPASIARGTSWSVLVSVCILRYIIILCVWVEI